MSQETDPITPEKQPIRRFLVIQLARFGDLLQTSRLIASLASEPGAELHLAVDRSLAGTARKVFPQAVVHALAAHGTGVADEAEVLAANLPALAELRGLSFERVYNLNLSGLNFALAALFDPETVRGYRYSSGQILKDTWPSMAMRWSRFRRESGLNLVDFWGLFAERPVAPGQVNPVARPKGGGVGVVLAGRHSRRSLAPETLAAIAGAVMAGTGFAPVTLLGTKAERPLARALENAFPPKARDKVLNLAGKTSMDDLFEVVGGLDVLLTPDTGTMHLAARLGTPVQAFFLSSAWCWETGPYGLGHRVWQASAQCAPCLESEDCPNGLECREPFAGREFLKHLSGNPDFQYPPGLLGLVGVFDNLGQTYRAVMGRDALESGRRRFRELAADLFGLASPTDFDPEQVRNLFFERDWMLDREPPRPDLLECLHPLTTSGRNQA